MTPTHFPSQKKSKELYVYTRRKYHEIFLAMTEIGLDTLVLEVPRGALSHANEFLTRKCFGGRVGSSSSQPGCFENLGDRSIWVLNHIMEFSEKMGLDEASGRRWGEDNALWGRTLKLYNM